MNAITTQKREEPQVGQDAAQYISGRGAASAAGAYRLDLHPMISVSIIVQDKDF
jgi:hypothetical protein